MILLGFLVAGTLGALQPLTAQVPPDGPWRSLETRHFRVTFPEGMDPLARRAAARAEDAFESLSTVFLDPPGGLIELLLTDHTETSNGFATAVPYNRIIVFVRPGMDDAPLSYFDDWMELIITHELVHVFQLDHSGPLGVALRSVLGRWEAGWPAFPAFDLPRWTTEGLATYYESSLTGSGRLRGSYIDMVLRTAALEDDFESLDQVTGSSPNWPSGNRAYVYGASFLDYLSRTYGAEHLGEFADAIAGQWFPYRVNAGAKHAFGVSFAERWTEWQTDLRVRFANLADSLARMAPITTVEILADQGRRAYFPSVSPDGARLAFARSDGRTDLQIRMADPSGSNDRKFVRLSNLSDFAWLPDGSLVVPQVEHTDPFRTRADLIHIDIEGRERRITRGARVDHPTPSPDGRSVVAVQSRGGTNRLVRVDIESGDVVGLTPFLADVYWSYPAWSPDGRWIAASRWSSGGLYDVVVLDTEGGLVSRITDDRAVDQAPAWSPDGRWLLWSSDRSGISNIYATEIDPESAAPGPLRQVTNVLGGTAYPSVGPDSRWIYFSSYHSVGWTIERTPFDPDAWFDPFPMEPGFTVEAVQDDPGRPPATGEVGPYRARSTLRPYYWEPTYTSRLKLPDRVGGPPNTEVLGPAFGVRTSGGDLVGRHRYGVSARFRTNGKNEAGVGYVYSGLGNPLLGLAASQVQDVDGPFTIGLPSGNDTTLYVGERERTLRASGTLLRRRVRSTTSISVAVAHIWDDREFLDPNLESSAISIFGPTRRLTELQIGAAFSTARAFPFSISAEAGLSVAVQGRTRRELALADTLRGSSSFDRSFNEVSGVAEAYRSFSGPGFSNHVLAARASLGAADGPGANAFHFSVGGAHGNAESLTGAELFGGSPLLFPVRGYFENSRSGRYAWSVSAEYRFPLINVHRGIGLWPVHMDRVSGALFVDAGNAWGDALPAGQPSSNPRENALASVGAELQTSVLALFSTRMFVRLGWAVRLSSGEGNPIYLRLGTAF